MSRVTTEEWPYKIDEILDGVKAIMKAKNQDYTAGSGDPFANFRGAESFGMDPLAGLCLRMDDKFQRVKAYFQNGELAVENEGLEDAFKDIIGYSVIALGMLSELEGDENPTLSEDADVAWADLHARHVDSKQHTSTVTINLPQEGGVDRETNSEESKPSWKDAPAWANWLAQDEDGEWYWYENEPELDLEQWNGVTGGRNIEAQSLLGGKQVAYTSNWQQTLEERPIGF